LDKCNYDVNAEYLKRRHLLYKRGYATQRAELISTYRVYLYQYKNHSAELQLWLKLHTELLPLNYNIFAWQG